MIFVVSERLDDFRHSSAFVVMTFKLAGDKYTIHVDPDLTIGASSKTSGLKGIIEDVRKRKTPGEFGGTVFVGGVGSEGNYTILP